MDYLIFELAKLDNAGIGQNGTQFLIEDTRRGFDGKSGRRLVGITAAHVAAIERLQPYNGVVWTKWLRDLSNPDKHRKLTEIRGDWTAHIEVDPHRRFDSAFPASDKPIRRTLHPIHGELQVKIALTSTLTLDDGTAILDALEEIKMQVAYTLNTFKPEF